jgi:hypothetical protein
MAVDPSSSRVNYESLNLSAASFTSAINAWIPASFGRQRTEAEKSQEFEQALRTAALEGENGRLGIGHASIGQRQNKNGATSLNALEKRLGRVGKGKGKEVEGSGVTANAMANGEQDEDEDESESRTKSVSKKAKTSIPSFLGKKKGKQRSEQSLPSTSAIPPSPTNAAKVQDKALDPTNESPPSVSPAPETPPSGDSETFPFEGPVALTSPRAKLSPLKKKRPASQMSPELHIDEGSNGINGEAATDPGPDDSQISTGSMSKTQKRREKRKRAKLSKSQS